MAPIQENILNRMQKYKLPLPLKLAIGFACLLVFFTISIYLYQFAGYGAFGDQETFGLFGDYIGGLTNPVLTFLTVVLLVWSIQIQIKELNATREELKETRRVHEKQLASNMDEQICRQLQDDANLYLNNCEELLDKPFFTIDFSVELGRKILSVNDLYNNTNYINQPELLDIFDKFESFREGSNTPESLHINTIRAQVGYGVYSTIYLLQYLKLEVLKFSWQSRALHLLTRCESMNIIPKDEVDRFRQALYACDDTVSK